MATFESDRPTLLKLCWLIVQQWKAELAYSRAQYRVSYYRKLKAKLENSKKTSEKWNDHMELVKKIESERLTALKKQKNLLDTKKRLRGPISVARTKIKATFEFEDGKIAGLLLPAQSQVYDATQIEEMSDQYEAETTLNRALTKEDNSKS